MVFNVPNPDSSAYLRNRLFYFPTEHGPRRAVAVASGDADRLVAFYAIVVKSSIVQLWTMVVVVGIYLSLRHRQLTCNATAASTGMFNAKRPFEVFQVSTKYIRKLGRRSPRRVMLWAPLSLLTLAASSALSTLVTPFLVVGHGAPVNPARIYVPSDQGDSDAYILKVNNIEVPSALRAAGSVQVANSSMTQMVQMDEPEVIQDKGGGEVVKRYGYRYNVTSIDFGLQQYHGLTLYVEGSCVTEYSWYQGDQGTSNFVEDIYYLWNNKSERQRASLYDAPVPIARFIPAINPDDNGSYLNVSYAIVISSVERSSYTRGVDPFYLTNATADKYGIYTVLSGRPVLSCWQSDTWTYKGQNFSITDLTRANGTLSSFPQSLNSVLIRFLYGPKLVQLGNRLGASALMSATTALGEFFDAGTANIQADLSRLVLASYISTVNTLTDTTLFAKDSKQVINDVPNLIEQEQLHELAGFILYGGNITALSIAGLITVPLLSAVIFLVAYLVTTKSWFPWYAIQGLEATILYSFLDENFITPSSQPGAKADSEKGNSDSDVVPKLEQWTRDAPAYYAGDPKKQPSFHIVYDKAKKTLVASVHPSATSATVVQTEQEDPAQEPPPKNETTTSIVEHPKGI